MRGRSCFRSFAAYLDGMATHANPDDALCETAVEPGYAAWKRAKIERGLEQARDRSAMIPVEQVWLALPIKALR
jgi:hypothetical protein